MFSLLKALLSPKTVRQDLFFPAKRVGDRLYWDSHEAMDLETARDVARERNCGLKDHPWLVVNDKGEIQRRVMK